MLKFLIEHEGFVHYVHFDTRGRRWIGAENLNPVVLPQILASTEPAGSASYTDTEGHTRQITWNRY
jgi:hypothetical protein